MTKFTLKGKLFEEKADEKIIAEHTVFSLEDHSDLGEWMPSTVENAMKALAGTFSEDVYTSRDFLVRLFLVPSKEEIGIRVNAILIEEFSCEPQTITLAFPHQEISIDSFVDALNTCKM
jgi:hypothetical protein